MTIDPSIFKAYDIRGIYPTQLNEDIAYMIGQAYVRVNKPRGKVLVGMDVRLHSETLKKKLIEGIMDGGVDVVDVGLISTDMLYFGVGKYHTDGGIQVTASHNTAEWHGFKMVKKGPVPMTLQSGISDIRDLVTDFKQSISSTKGSVTDLNIWNGYCKHVLSWIVPSKIQPMKVVINPNFGLAGLVFEKIVKMGNLPLDLVKLNAVPDGSFPKGKPDPFIPENRDELIKYVIRSKADLGISWDADGDRIFFCADRGIFVEPYFLNTILIKKMLKKYPGEKILYDPRYTWALRDTIMENGGKPILVKVGHSYIKEGMIKHNALFAVESSGHTYYRDYWYSDCGMIPALQVLGYLSETREKLSSVMKDVMSKYFISGEINNKVKDKERKMNEIAAKYKNGKQSRLDGIIVDFEDWRFCVRPSNTEPLLRLTLEAKSKKLMIEKRDELLALIKK